MVLAVSVVVIAQDFRSELDRLIESFDLQSLPTDAFEIVVVDTGSTDGTLERLQKLSTRRPNLKVVEDHGSGGASAAVPLEHCDGEYVLPLEPGQLLFPEALERMYAAAVQNDSDVISARVCETGVAVGDLWTADRSEIDPGLVGAALAGPAVLMRRSLVNVAENPQTDRLPDSAKIGVLSSYPALLVSAVTNPERAGSVMQAAEPYIAWEAGRLRLVASGSVSTDADLTLAQPLALVRHTTSGQSFLLGSGAYLTAWDDAWSWDFALDVDLRQLAIGELPDGLWEIDVQLVGAGQADVIPVTLPWVAAPSALLGTLMVVPAPAGETMQLDVGPTTWPLVATPDPANATVTESAVGSRLVLTLPDLYVADSAVIEGELGLEGLRLPATLVTDGSSARLVAYVSGLQGAPRIGTRFGRVPYRQTGLRLEIDNIGEMVVAKVPPPAPKAAPAAAKPAVKKAAPKKPAEAISAAATSDKKADPKPLTRVQHLRRALPSQLDPVAKMVQQSSLARRVYRKIANL